MEKGALLPLRFYPDTSWQDYHKIRKYTKDKAYFREHYIYIPAFQLTLPDVGMHWEESDFTTIEIVNVETEVATDISGGIYQSYSKAGDFRGLVSFRFPHTHFTGAAFDSGLYYVHVSDGLTNWYSEVFELCNLGLDALSAGFDDDSNFAFFDNDNYDSDDEWATAFFCKTAAANRAEAYTDVDVILGEELDFHVNAFAYSGPPCGSTDWNDPLYFELRTSTGLVVSNTVEVDAVGDYSFTITAEAGGTVRLYMYLEDGVQSKGHFYCFLQRRYSEDNVQLRWSHDDNFCKIFYEDDYENVMFLDSKQVIDENAIEETVIEDDETNKYPIIGTNKKWNSLQFASGEAMLNAMSLLRLHKYIKIYRETGEVMDVDEINLEQTILEYNASLIKLIYREVSCSADACGFDICCPTEDLPMMEDVIYGGIGNLPAAASWTDKYFIVEVLADQFAIYTSNGAAWSVVNTWDVANYCVEARQNFNDIDYTPGREAIRFFWYESGSAWRAFIELASVTNNTDGTATLNSDTEYKGGLYYQAEYEDSDGWHTCGPVLGPTTAGAGALAVDCACGAGTFNFRIHIRDNGCDYGYSEFVPQTITDV